MVKKITESDLDLIRAYAKTKMSEKRFRHTLGVERMAARLAALYCPLQTNMLRAAALFHDVMKETDSETQKEIFARHGYSLSAVTAEAPKVWHGISAALLISEEFPQYADPALCRAVRYHTTGCADMTVFDAIIYLADYIEDERVIPECVALREAFFSAEPEKMTEKARCAHLAKILLQSLEMTVDALRAKDAIVTDETKEAIAWLRQEGARLKTRITF